MSTIAHAIVIPRVPSRARVIERAQSVPPSKDFATGMAEGERCRNTNGKPSRYQLIGRDDYAAGFRAGYFRRLAVPSDRECPT